MTSPAQADPAAQRGEDSNTALCSMLWACSSDSSSLPSWLWAARWFPPLCSGDVFPSREEFGDFLGSCLSHQDEGTARGGRHSLKCWGPHLSKLSDHSLSLLEWGGGQAWRAAVPGISGGVLLSDSSKGWP